MYLIGAGSSGIVYRSNDIAIKVGDIQLSEVKRQLFFHKHNLALPVLFFGRRLPIQQYIARHLCYVHGKRNDYHQIRLCSCHIHRADILVMPYAEAITTETEETALFSEYLHNEAIRYFGHGRDRRVVNLARYKGKLVGLDWG